MNRKRVLWPLLLVGAFALGVLAAHVQAGAIFLPLVARASPGEETVRAENVHYQASQEVFYGELVNETACTVSAARVTISLRNAEGTFVGQQTGYTIVPILGPGERTPFRVPWLNTPAWDSYQVIVHWDPTERLAVESAELFEDEDGDWQVTTTIRNQLPVRIRVLAVGIVLYDPSGEIVGYCDTRDWGKSGRSLASGEVWTYTFGVAGPTDNTGVVSCAAYVVGYGGER